MLVFSPAFTVYAEFTYLLCQPVVEALVHIQKDSKDISGNGRGQPMKAFLDSFLNVERFFEKAHC